jgi:hypothetical protein
MAHKPSDVAVLNVIQAAGADAVLSGGKLQINDGSNDLLTDAIVLAFAEGYTKTAYAAGTPKVATYDFSGVSLLANTAYRLAVVFPKRIGFNDQQVIDNGGNQEANQLIAIREYIVSTGSTSPSADDLKQLFIDRINADAGAIVTAASGGVGILQITQDDVNDGEFTVDAPAGTVENVTTPYVAPSGTPALVEAVAPTFSSPTGEYTTWTIDVNMLRRHNAVSGGQVFYPEFIQIFADETAANFAGFETAIDAMLDGTHTPVSDYLGV